MDKYRQIAELMKGFQRSGNVVFPAIVESIEGATCTVKVDDLSISDVKLKPTTEETENTVLLTPAIDSTVLVGSLSGDYNNLFILHADALSAAYLKVDETSLKLDKNGVEINGGKNGGAVKIDAMISWMQDVYSDLQVLKTQLATHPTAGNGAPLALTFNPTAPSPLKSNFEDKKVKH